MEFTQSLNIKDIINYIIKYKEKSIINLRNLKSYKNLLFGFKKKKRTGIIES